ncbi:MAG: hypothetical protein ACXVK3_15995, partial [Candidatus Angelobacter sp.]
MRQVRVLLLIAGLAVLSACAGAHYLTAGTDANNSVPPGSHTVAGSVISREPSLTPTGPASRADKLIALTFDDGPRPYVLFGSKAVHPAPGLVD